ncbi:5-oxoprolinase subunit PxpA [Balneola vulgaris]|uniref:5-oxoprolinase subunit PxpA n=1 Tax=Balneola vulgaris TaxID=287535 RepID=UPI0003780C08|nr:5-oxoprolinase subunit PxpA [Balneola vulgaris]
MEIKVDLNCDLGEWRTDDGPKKDEAIMPYISSCNIACGGHIGDVRSMTKTVELARSYEVAIGAHPSYPDRSGFGRREMEMDPNELSDSIKQQILNLNRIVEENGSSLHHVKPHGALYNAASVQAETANLISKAIVDLDLNVIVYGQSGSKFEQAAIDHGLVFKAEVFADRSYNDDLTLRSRKLEGAVLSNAEAVLEQIRSMVLSSTVTSYNGNTYPIKAETICLHSDTDDAQSLAKSIHKFLEDHGVKITSV